jgi:hypothetical protein
MALPIIVYCPFNNLFMLEDALRFQRLLEQTPENCGLDEDELGRLRGN